MSAVCEQACSYLASKRHCTTAGPQPAVYFRSTEGSFKRPERLTDVQSYLQVEAFETYLHGMHLLHYIGMYITRTIPASEMTYIVSGGAF